MGVASPGKWQKVEKETLPPSDCASPFCSATTSPGLITLGTGETEAAEQLSMTPVVRGAFYSHLVSLRHRREQVLKVQLRGREQHRGAGSRVSPRAPASHEAGPPPVSPPDPCSRSSCQCPSSPGPQFFLSCDIQWFHLTFARNIDVRVNVRVSSSSIPGPVLDTGG